MVVKISENKKRGPNIEIALYISELKCRLSIYQTCSKMSLNADCLETLIACMNQR